VWDIRPSPHARSALTLTVDAKSRAMLASLQTRSSFGAPAKPQEEMLQNTGAPRACQTIPWRSLRSTSCMRARASTTVPLRLQHPRPIARNVGEAAKGTMQVASNITDVNRGASETGSASAQVLSSAQSLSSESNHLKLEVDKFLSTVRAA
jgi:hypothetical protein